MGNLHSDKKNYQRLGILGEGASCQVYKVQHKKNQQLFALKCLSKAEATNKELFHTEKNNLELVKGCDNIITLRHAWSDKKFYYLLIDLATGGDCFDRIQGKFSERDASRLTRDMLMAVHGCHKNYIAHRDLKPENFVFLNNEDKSPMLLIDFGVARRVKPGDKPVTQGAGSMYYIAPECLERNDRGLTGEELRASDMWSVGVITFLLVCGYPPFNGRSQEEIFNATRSGVYRWPRREKNQAPVSNSVQDFVNRLLVKDTSKRMTVEEALKHPWIADADHMASQEPIPRDVLDSLKSFHNNCQLKNAVGRVLAHRMQDKDRERLQKLFHRYDKNGDGKLSEDELVAMFKELNLGSSKDAKAMHAMMDSDHNKLVDADEFVHGMTVGGLANSSAEELKNSFELFDADGDGFVTAAEIQQICHQFLKPKEIKALIQQVDADGDGRVNFDEWMAAMRDITPNQLREEPPLWDSDTDYSSDEE